MTKKNSNLKKKMYALSAALTCSTMASSALAFADGDLGDVIKEGLQEIAKAVNTIFNPLAALALGICIVILVIGRNSKSAESSISWAKRIVICFIIFNLIGTILNYAETIFKGTGFSDYIGG